MNQHKIFLTIILVATSHLLMAGGWPQLQFHGYFKLSQWGVVSDKHFTDAGLIDPNTTFGIFNTSLYGEYGFTNRLTGILYAPFFSRAYFNNTISGTTGEVLIPGEAINSFGDTDIGLKYGLITNKPIVLSATVMFGLPLGNAAGGSQGNLQTGDGEFNQILRLDAGTSFKLGKQNAYGNIYAGFNNRTKGFSDEVRYGVEAGVNLFKEKLLALVRVYGVKSLKNGTLGPALNSTSIFANNTEHLTISPEFAFQVNKSWGVSLTAAKAVTGRIIFASTSYSAGIYVKI